MWTITNADCMLSLKVRLLRCPLMALWMPREPASEAPRVLVLPCLKLSRVLSTALRASCPSWGCPRHHAGAAKPSCQVPLRHPDCTAYPVVGKAVEVSVHSCSPAWKPRWEAQRAVLGRCHNRPGSKNCLPCCSNRTGLVIVLFLTGKGFQAFLGKYR